MTGFTDDELCIQAAMATTVALRPLPRTWSAVCSFFRDLGPGLVTGAADDDPSGIATYSVAGAQLGTSLLWTALVTWPLMAAVQMMCARVGMVSGRGLASCFRAKFPRAVVLTAIVALLIANTINVGADLAGMADAATMLTRIPTQIWIVAFAVGITWATVKLRYGQIAATLKWLTLVLFAYVVDAFVVHPNWMTTLRDTFLPSLPHGKVAVETLVAILGTTISPYLFFWQASQEIEEQKAIGRTTVAKRRGATLNEIRCRKLDVGIGTFFSNLVMFFIILATAATLHASGKNDIQTSREAAVALMPVAGHLAAGIYTAGIIGVGLLAIPTLTGSAAFAFAEVLGWRNGLDQPASGARPFYMLIIGSTVAAVVMNFIHISPVRALYWTAVINGVLAPFLLLGILIIASDKKLMAGQASPRWSRIVVGVTTVAMFVAAIAMFVL